VSAFGRLHPRTRMPPLDGATGWLNSEPLDPAGLRGKAVLVNFWTLTCINWLRQEPYVRAWSQAYRDDGLVVIGAHTPEFSFEHDVDLIRRAMEKRDIDYPVAVDSDYGVWNAFANHYWPALYFIDTEGMIQDHRFGEGEYEMSERRIQELLGIERELVSVDDLGVGAEAAADWEHLRTPETYLGVARGGPVASSDDLRLNDWGLNGDWAIGGENVLANQAGASIAFRFHARDAHLVLNHAGADPIPFRVTLDGEAAGQSHGVDVDDSGRGVLGEGGLYQLIRQPEGVRERTLEITFAEPGAEAYSFTFG
jgi:thiol-disulfide isomerase/thioredoxin